MGLLDELLLEARALQREVAGAGGAPTKELSARLEEVRQRIEEELLLADTPAAGYLTDALVALQLALRARQAGDEGRATDLGEQAGYFLQAAEQAR